MSLDPKNSKIIGFILCVVLIVGLTWFYFKLAERYEWLNTVVQVFGAGSILWAAFKE